MAKDIEGKTTMKRKKERAAIENKSTEKESFELDLIDETKPEKKLKLALKTEESDDSETGSQSSDEQNAVESSEAVEETKAVDLLRIHVSNVDGKTTREELKEHFPTASQVILPRLRFSKMKVRFAFIEFDNEAEASSVMEEKQDSILHGRELKLAYAAKKQGSEAAKPQSTAQCSHCGLLTHSSSDCPQIHEQNSRTIHVTNLHESTTEEHLISTFNHWPIEEVRIPVTERGVQRGFAFVVFQDEAVLDSVMKEKQGCRLKGNKLKLEAVSGNKTQDDCDNTKKNKSLFVRLMDEKTTEADLKSHFPSAISVRLPVSAYRDGTKKHIAFVDFKSSKEAQRVMEEKQGQKLKGKKLKLQISR